MDFIEWLVFIPLTAVVTVLVSFISQRIFERQERKEEFIQSLAGVETIANLPPESGEPFTDDVFQITHGDLGNKLELMSNWGFGFGHRSIHGLQTTLSSGVSVEIILPDPRVNQSSIPFLEDISWNRQLLTGSGSFAVLLTKDPILENLVFVDSDKLFLYFPDSIREDEIEIYQLRPGEKSMFKYFRNRYNLYRSRAKRIDDLVFPGIKGRGD